MTIALASRGDDAKISIIDVSGKIVHAKTMLLASGGKYFFYFAASSVPTGTYFYMIESPLGNVIVQKTLLVVK